MPSANLWQFRSDDPHDALAERPRFIEALRRRFGDAFDLTAAEIVFTELVGNVIRHAPGPIEIRLIATESACLEVIDSGPGFEFEPALPPESSECGRGLYIVSRLSSNVRTVRRDGSKARICVTLTAYGAPRVAPWNGAATETLRHSSNGKS